VFPINDPMRSQDGEGSTPVLSESRRSQSANLATWATGEPADSRELETGVTGQSHEGLRHPEVVPEAGSCTPDAGPRFVSPGSALPRLEEVSLAPELPPRVLVAEDNHDLQQIFARQLTLLGLEVVGVSNGRDAVDLALAAHQVGNPFDLILMDLEMPIVDGYEATRRIRDGGFGGPIVALSGHSTDEYLLDSIKMGCNDCVCKPIDWSQLAELIRRFVPGCNAPGPILIPDN
jgi:CheY-like chemotaxis protein